MEIETSMQKMKDFYAFLLDFIDAEDENLANDSFYMLLKKN